MSALPLPVHDPRLVVAIATRGDRLETVLRAYLAGPGREVFEIGDVSLAQAMIADHDHPASRAAMLRFVHHTGRPVIALATRDPGLSGIVWVPKPVHYEALATAAERVACMLCSAPAARPGTLQLLPPAPRPAAGAVLPRRRRPILHGPYHTSARDDWTGKIIWMAFGALGIAALASVLGWEPGVQGWRPPTARVQPPAIDTRALEKAVHAAWADAPDGADPIRTGSHSITPATAASAEAQSPRAWATHAHDALSDVLRPSRLTLPLALVPDASAATATAARAERRALEAAVARSLAWSNSEARD